VPRNAVIDGHLLDLHLPGVKQVELISSEKYYEHMND
jgi:hypothetical protein